ncbi:MAG: class II aldolase/adducin family protein [Pseudomonadales bacterium]
MTPSEGTIQFAYDLRPPSSPVINAEQLASLNGWREMFRRLGLLGQEQQRYEGLGFGNLSLRCVSGESPFVISASQTSGDALATATDMVRVTGCNLQRFWVDAEGSQPPSSETLTHGMIYSADPRIDWVFHCHSPDLWGQATELGLPCTPQDVGYGTPAMVTAVAELLATQHSRPLVFATLGHTDGIFACGQTARDTGGLLLVYLARALTQNFAQAAELVRDSSRSVST